MHGVFDASFCLFHFSLGRRADFNHSHATHELRQSLLQFLAIVVTRRLLNLAANFLHAALDVALLAFAFDDGGVVLVDGDLFCLSEILNLDVFQQDSKIFGDGFPSGEGCDVLQHGFAPVAEAGSLYGCNLQCPAKFIDDQSSQRFALNIFGNDDERPSAFSDLFEQGQQIFHRTDLLFVDEDVGVLECHFHTLGISHEVRRKITAVELHAFDNFELSLEGPRFFHGNDAVLANLLHGVRDDVANGRVVVGGNAADLSDHVAGNRLRKLVQFAVRPLAALGINVAANRIYGFLNPALHGHGISAGCDSPDAFTVDGLSQDGRGCRTVTGNVGRFAGDFADHLCADVFKAVLQFDLFCNGDAVFGDGGRSELLLDDYVATSGPKSHFHRVCQQIHAAQDRLPRLFSVYDLFCHDSLLKIMLLEFCLRPRVYSAWKRLLL